MRLRWVALGVLLTALVSVGGTVLSMDVLFSGSPSDIVYSRPSEDVGTPRPAVQDPMLNYCVSYVDLGTQNHLCQMAPSSAPPKCYSEAVIGRALPEVCRSIARTRVGLP